MKVLQSKIVRIILIVVLVLILTGTAAARKLYSYAADPSGEKDCPPLFPTGGGDPTTRTAADMDQPGLNLAWDQKGGTINDVSCLNKTPVYGIVHIESVDDIREALMFAAENDLKVSMSAVKHSQGGQAFFTNAVVLNMMGFNQMSLDEEEMVLTVQSGATWHDIQNLLHPKYAVKAMQSTDIFSVGGSISVNAHGMDHTVGALGNTIRSMRVMLPDGTIKNTSRTENSELFHHVIGGYGLFGVILDVELDITENTVYETERSLIDYQAFPQIFNEELLPDEDLGLFYGHLSTSPDTFLRELMLYTYRDTHVTDADIPPLADITNIKMRRLVLNHSKQGPTWMRLKWWAEKTLEPKIETCSVVSRNQAMKDGEACMVSRNQPMHDSVPYLYNDLKDETDILHEYFIPRENFIPFVDGLRTILQENAVNTLNASVRVVHPEENALNYAPTEMFSIVLYINQKTDAAGNEKMGRVTRELIDLTIANNGRFFLPYQLHFTPEQLAQAYPEFSDFIAYKQQVDPNLLLTNTLYEKYAPAFE